MGEISAPRCGEPRPEMVGRLTQPTAYDAAAFASPTGLTEAMLSRMRNFRFVAETRSSEHSRHLGV